MAKTLIYSETSLTFLYFDVISTDYDPKSYSSQYVEYYPLDITLPGSKH